MRSLRLQALSDTPEAFDSTLDRERAWTAAEWRSWIADGATFIFEDRDQPKGLAAGFPHDSDRASVFLVSMWVHPDHRGTGAADALVASVLSWARSEGAAEVRLHVGHYNGRARRFYERNGFQDTGQVTVRERDRLLEIEMVYVLDRPRGR